MECRTLHYISISDDRLFDYDLLKLQDSLECLHANENKDG